MATNFSYFKRYNKHYGVTYMLEDGRDVLVPWVFRYHLAQNLNEPASSVWIPSWNITCVKAKEIKIKQTVRRFLILTPAIESNFSKWFQNSDVISVDGFPPLSGLKTVCFEFSADGAVSKWGHVWLKKIIVKSIWIIPWFFVVSPLGEQMNI